MRTLQKWGFAPAEKPLLLASYKVAYEIAKQKRPHTIAESLIKPCALEMASVVLGKDAKRKLQAVPIYNNTTSTRICDISYDILFIYQVITNTAIKNSQTKMSLQLDESTDIFSCLSALNNGQICKG